MASNKTEEDLDGLDDLDDVLEQFTKPAPPIPRPPASAPSSSISEPSTSSKKPSVAEVKDDDDEISQEFARRFAEEMEAMMRHMTNGGNVPTPPSTSNPTAATTNSEEESKAFREAWERLIIQDLESGGGGIAANSLTPDPSEKTSTAKDKQPASSLSPSSDPSSSSATTAKSTAPATDATDPDPDAFQRAIRQAMEKMQNSDDALKADSSQSAAMQDSLANLLSSLGDLNLGGSGGEGEGGLEGMLESMMSELMSKDILYEPLKELDSKYPEYLATHATTLPADDIERYTSQKERVSQLVAIFEAPSYSDDDAEQAMKVLTLMTEMQSYGAPPAEIMGPMPAGLELGTDGQPKVPEGCIIT